MGIASFLELNTGGLAEFTDDTQMTLFTAEGIIIARDRARWDPTEAVYRAYVRWLRTQKVRLKSPTNELTREGWLMGYEALWRVKSPGQTCLTSLASSYIGSVESPINDSKGCGGVMRVAPMGLAYPGDTAFDHAVKAAALTHGHPTGYLAAGTLAHIIAEIIDGKDLPHAIQTSLETLKKHPRHEETLHAVEKALKMSAEPELPSPERVEKLGGGWVAEEALAIALFCALTYPTNYRGAVLLAVNHSGDSDSTGAVTGNIMGALLGSDALPPDWLDLIELRSEIKGIAGRLFEGRK
jgi:ADP-ribosylglycohydrolase